MIKVLLIGSNPSQKSSDLAAFQSGTRSRAVLDEWFKDLDAELSYINICDNKTKDNKPLTKSEIQNNLPLIRDKLAKYQDYKFVTLGKAATNALTLLRVNFFEMPHPSGLNRLLNDKSYIEEKIKRLKDFLF